ncbi:MAG: hypothetical protein QNK23_16725 [Crocinitomicaceae bacterium]|nr:hypothetical protein [Crocinitomicaceae bacterium]
MKAQVHTPLGDYLRERHPEGLIAVSEEIAIIGLDDPHRDLLLRLFKKMEESRPDALIIHLINRGEFFTKEMHDEWLANCLLKGKTFYVAHHKINTALRYATAAPQNALKVFQDNYFRMKGIEDRTYLETVIALRMSYIPYCDFNLGAAVLKIN